MAKGQRLDQSLVELGLAPSRSKAQALIMAGKVKVDGAPAAKPGQSVKADADIEVDGPDHPYVSRGGVKLAGALDQFNLDPANLRCLDIGASTGGFTDCLLQRGASSVVAVDVGYGQIAWKIRQDERVEVIERTNARNMSEGIAPGPFDLIVIDVSFISLTLILPNLTARLGEGGRVLCMVKPQFEAGREYVGPGGVVRDEAVRTMAVDKVARCLEELGLLVDGRANSPITGPKGNVEIFLLARKPAVE